MLQEILICLIGLGYMNKLFYIYINSFIIILFFKGGHVKKRLFDLFFRLGFVFSITLTLIIYYGVLTSAIQTSFIVLFAFTMPTVALILSYFKIYRNKGDNDD